MRKSEERFRLIANTAPVMIWMTDIDGQLTYVNQTYVELTGLPFDLAAGNGWQAVPHPDELERIREVFVKASAERQRFQMEQRLRRHDGEYRWVLSAGVPRYDVDGSFSGYIGTAVDITERKLAERALSTINQRLIEAQEDERGRVARELHDDVNQRLSVLAWRLDGILNNASASPTHLKDQIAQVREEALAVISDVQALSHRLHSPRLEHLGLVESAAALCREVGDHQGVEIHFESEGLPKDVPLRPSQCLYRVLQEALQNAVKHSGAKSVSIHLTSSLDRLQLSIADNGMGFDVDGLSRKGLGLASMTERLDAVGGTLTIHSARNAGTRLVVTVPLAPSAVSCAPSL
jgi:PAS domain S-box-containing protein